eukprot:NODE_896_length_1777_cov_21.245455_g840_i0.p1 GENE.NODE_896_length_1777_cov_21.245455_g840_i0~~NODE_896_length_1777_cov_21.245455_g840_i0.p1  ORF type:complete len:554 (+),score=145.73 NODE_896_length_1777_cov_21.245455_g840_i0:83-1744(+)
MNVATSASERAQWRSKGAFLLAGVGAGFASFFRFPHILLRYGGSAFLYPYLICLVVFGVPVLTLELAIGQIFQHGIVGSMGKVHRRFRGVGYLAVLVGFLTCSFLLVAAAWSVYYLGGAFQTPLPWDDHPHFFENAIGTHSPTVSLNWPLVLALLAEWLVVFVCISRGIQSLAWACYFTIPLTLALLLLMCVRSLYLSGSPQGIRIYLTPTFTQWASLELWLQAMCQSFLSLGVGTGMMPAFGSYNQRSRDVVKWAFCIALITGLYSLVYGLTVYSVLGGMGAFDTPTPFGPELLYVVLPGAIAELPSVLNNLLALLLALALLSMGVVIGFEYSLSVQTILTDVFPNAPNILLAAVISAAGVLLGLPYCFTSGFHLFQVVNYFVPTFGITAVVGLQCIAVGYFFDATSLRQKVREKAHKGWRRAVDYVLMGCFYSINDVQFRINKLEKSRVSRPVWCTIIKYLLPATLLVLWVHGIIARLNETPSPLLPEIHPPWYVMIWGWLFLLLIPLVIIPFALRSPPPVEQEVMWHPNNDQDNLSVTDGDLDSAFNLNL